MTIQTATKRVTISNRDGLHLRTAAALAQTAHAFHSEIRIVCDNRIVDAKSVLDLLSLVAEQGSVLDLEASGPDCRMAVDAVASLIANGFTSPSEGNHT
jgi:phosphotransferase system HPr (HPr) family protein